MQHLVNILNDYAFNKMDNGLLMVPLPTGSGKTSDTHEFIYQAVNERKGKIRILYITPLKKNLQLRELKNLFLKHGDKNFDQEVLWVKSNNDCVLENLPKLLASKKIPQDILISEKTKKLIEAVNFIYNAYKSNLPEMKELIKIKKEEIRYRLEREFRSFIKIKITNNIKEKYKIGNITKKNRLDYIKKDMPWLIELYPQILIDEKQVLLMSMDKFLLQTDPIIEAEFYGYKKLIKDSIIFLDEFDSTKERILTNLINNADSGDIDIISAFRIIHEKLKAGSITSKILIPSSRARARKDKGKLVSDAITIINKQSNEINDELELDYIFKNNEKQSLKKVFLFQDAKNILINDKQDRNQVFYKPNHDTKTNEICLGKEDTENSHRIMMMLRRVSGFLESFCTAVSVLAINYMELKKDRNEEIDLRNAIYSILDIFFPGKHISYKDFFVNHILLYSRNFEDRNSVQFDSSFFENGFKFTTIEDEDNHDFRSVLRNTELQTTPEKILLDICKQAKVFAISATANYDSLLGNYALKNYLKPKLKASYYELTEEEKTILQNDFNELTCGYDKVKINIDKIDTSEIYSQLSWENRFGKNKGTELYNIVGQRDFALSDKNNYTAKRYLRLAIVFKKFMETSDIYSFLCLLNLFPQDDDKDKSNFSEDIIKRIFNLIGEGKYTFDKNVVTLKSGTNYEEDKGRLEKRLQNGEKILVLSTYATIGAGQNLQYGVPEILKDKVVQINDIKLKSDKKKDFDAIYLDNPTNLIANLREEDGIQELLKYIVHVEYLTEIGELSFKMGRYYIQNAFKKLFFNEKVNTAIERSSESYSIYATKVLVQAVGRICRTFIKNPNIYIFYDSAIADFLNKETAEQNILNPEFKELLNNIGENIAPVEGNEKRLSIYAVNRTVGVLSRIQSYITKIQYRYWDEEEMRQWTELRHELLKMPTLSEDEYINCKDLIRPFYIELPNNQNKYWFKREGDYNQVEDISFKQKLYYEEVSSDAARLSLFMKIPEVEQCFNENNFAKQFIEKKYILCPPAFTNIYKGALGEYSGKAILAKHNIQLEEIADNRLFELFDYKVPNKDIYVDFKHWNEYSFYTPTEEEIKDKIFTKLADCNGKVALIINILAEEKYKISEMEQDGLKIIEIPNLYSANGTELNTSAITRISNIIKEN